MISSVNNSQTNFGASLKFLNKEGAKLNAKQITPKMTEFNLGFGVNTTHINEEVPAKMINDFTVKVGGVEGKQSTHILDDPYVQGLRAGTNMKKGFIA